MKRQLYSILFDFILIPWRGAVVAIVYYGFLIVYPITCIHTTHKSGFLLGAKFNGYSQYELLMDVECAVRCE
jgi:hypothetical protein